MGPISRVSRLLPWSSATIILLIAFWLGGWPWAALWTLAFLSLARQEGAARAVTVAGPACLWLALFVWTGDRRLFFPFAMHLAQASSPVLLAAAFFAIRIQQSATLHVLTVEFLVAAAVLSVGYAIQSRGPQGLPARTLAAAIVAILALIGLLL